MPGGERTRLRLRRPQRGFVLAATLVVLAIVSVAVGYFAERAAAALRVAQARGAALEARLGMADAQAELLFAMNLGAASPFGLGGATAVVFDDRTYRADRDTRISIQDAAGLLNLNAFDDERLTRLLLALGVPASEIPSLLDTLKDYIDADDLRRLAGAEADDYSAAGLPPPRNARLLTPQEASAVYGWTARRELWGASSFESLVSTSNVTGFNPNTAPRAVLQTVPGVTPKAAEALLLIRNAGQVLTERLLRDAGALLPPLSSAPIVALPAATVRVTQWAPGVSARLRYALTLTPLDPIAPWRIDYQYRLSPPVATDAQDESRAPILPAIRTAAPAAAPLGLPIGP